jgi:DnaJ-class molecular chaperone
MHAKDYYKILGVGEDATPEQLKKAFRKIAQASHPDTHPGDKAAEDRFKEASEAYDILSDPEKRQKYDALRKYGFGPAGFEGGGYGPSPGYPGASSGYRVHFDTGDLKDFDFADIFAEDSPYASLFEQLFEQMGAPRPHAGASRPRSRPRGRARAHEAPRNGARSDAFFRQDGLDVHVTIWLKLAQLEKGAKVKVRTPSGKKALVKIPAGTRIGSVLRLPGMGLANEGRHGDQYVHVEAVA